MNFLHSKEALICTDISGEFMCYLRANGCIETVSIQGCILTPFPRTWSFEKRKYKYLFHISFDISHQDAATVRYMCVFIRNYTKNIPSFKYTMSAALLEQSQLLSHTTALLQLEEGTRALPSLSAEEHCSANCP